jgi:hypothetical protein
VHECNIVRSGIVYDQWTGRLSYMTVPALALTAFPANTALLSEAQSRSQRLSPVLA